MKMFYKGNEVDISETKKSHGITKIKGGIQIRYYKDHLYVAKGKRIQKYFVKNEKTTLCEDIQINATIRDFLIFENYIVIQNSDCSISIFDRNCNQIASKKTWNKKRINQLSWKDENKVFITIDKVLYEMNILNFELAEVCNYGKIVNGECVSIQSSEYNDAENEFRCFALFYPNNSPQAKMEVSLITVNLSTLKTEAILLNETLKTLCKPTFHLAQEKISFVNKESLTICDKELTILNNIRLPYYKVIKDGGGLFKPEEFTQFPVEVRFLKEPNELMVLYEHSIMHLDIKKEEIMYFYDLEADLLLNCFVLEYGAVVFNTGFYTYIVDTSSVI